MNLMTHELHQVKISSNKEGKRISLSHFWFNRKYQIKQKKYNAPQCYDQRFNICWCELRENKNQNQCEKTMKLADRRNVPS